MDKYLKLLSPVRAGRHILKNRLLSTDSLPNKIQGPETFPAEGFRALMSQIAKSAAVVTLAEWNNKDARELPIAMAHQPVFDMEDPSVANYFSMMADDIHFHQSKLIMCLQYKFPEGYTQYGTPPLGPHLFKLKPGDPLPTSKMLPAERMHEVVDDIVARVGWYLNHGVDGFTMRCDNELRYVPCVRDDEYGCETIAQRMKLTVDTYKAVKEAYGDRCICEAIVAWEQPYGYGMTGNDGRGVTFDDVLEFCKAIDPYVDLIQVREHDGCRSHPHGYNFTPGDHPAVEACGRMKQAGVKALLEPVGGFQDPEEMERILDSGKCDMFGAARAFFADYDYMQKLYAGKGEDITPCILCNKCHGTAQFCDDHQLSICSVNPRHSNDYYMHRMVSAATVPQKVAVIGGGAAGLRAAITAAERGHSVVLYEKSDRLGGQLLHSDVFSFKWPMKRYKDWLIRQVGKYGIDVRMNTAPTRDELIAGGYDAMIVALGAKPVLPRSIEGLVDDQGLALYPTCHDVFLKQPQLGKKVVIVGGSITGLETAIHLLRNGHVVTLLTRQSKIAHDNDVPMHSITMGYSHIKGPDGKYHESPVWAIYDDFSYLTGVTTTKVEGNTVYYTKKDGSQDTVTADSIVICGGTKALTDEAMRYAGITTKFFIIGDCDHAGNIQKCNRQAFAAAMHI